MIEDEDFHDRKWRFFHWKMPILGHQVGIFMRFSIKNDEFCNKNGEFCIKTKWRISGRAGYRELCHFTKQLGELEILIVKIRKENEGNAQVYSFYTEYHGSSA